MGNTSYDLEEYYRTDPGQRANNAIEQEQLTLSLKQQVTPQDSVYGMALGYNGTGGDLRQYYSQSEADLGLHTRETEAPLLVLGYHHDWGTGSHSLFLAGRLQDTYHVNDPESQFNIVGIHSGPPVIATNDAAVQNYQSKLVIYTTEFQQFWQGDHSCIIGGLRFQDGSFKTQNRLLTFDFDDFTTSDNEPPVENSNDRFERIATYGYYLWQPLDSLQLSTGLAYDWITFPKDFRSSPIDGGQQTEDQVSPKAGILWRPFPKTVLRAAYTTSLSGASLEQSFQLEPSQVAGFNQLFRSLIPESVSGENAGARFQTWGVSLEQELETGTYLGITGQVLISKINRQAGIFTVIRNNTIPMDAAVSSTPEHLDYVERDLNATVDQL